MSTEYYQSYYNNLYSQYSGNYFASGQYGAGHGYPQQNYPQSNGSELKNNQGNYNYPHQNVNSYQCNTSDQTYQPDISATTNNSYSNDGVDQHFSSRLPEKSNFNGYQCTESTQVVPIYNAPTEQSTEEVKKPEQSQRGVKRKCDDSPALRALLTQPKQKIKNNQSYFYQKLWSESPSSTPDTNETTNSLNQTPTSPQNFYDDWYNESCSPASFTSSTIVPEIPAIIAHHHQSPIANNHKLSAKEGVIQPTLVTPQTPELKFDDGVGTPPLSPKDSVSGEKSVESSTVSSRLTNYSWLQNGSQGMFFGFL